MKHILDSDFHLQAKEREREQDRQSKARPEIQVKVLNLDQLKKASGNT